MAATTVTPKRTKKQRTHNEYFRPVSLGGRKSCPKCRAKLESGEFVWSHGNYISAKWYTVGYCCKTCWSQVAGALVGHAEDCPDKCRIALVPYQCKLPEWMVLEATCPSSTPPASTPSSSTPTAA